MPVVIGDVTVTVTASGLDQGLVDACGERPTWFCEAGWNLTHNRLFASAADWVITRPLAAIFIAALAWLVNRWVRRSVTTLVVRLTTGRSLARAALQRLGADEVADGIETIDERSSSRSETLAAVSRASVSGFVWAMAVLLILGAFNIDLAPLLAGAGIAGLAVGFGAQSLVKDTIAGFFMLLEDHCGVGDEVDLGHATGTVETITLRVTQIRGTDGTLWSVPNGSILRVGNRTRNWSQGFIEVTVAHDADIELALAAIVDAVAEAAASPTVADALSEQPPPQVQGIERLEPAGTVIRVAVRTQPGAHLATMREFRRVIATTLAARSIPLAKA